MQNSEYLPIGHKVGGHYEIVKILGEDDFEIVYIVKDIHRVDALFVLKELFLKEYSLRDNEYNVYTLEKSKQNFIKTKKAIISEVNLLKNIKNSNSVEIYGCFEENSTVYSIMKFVKNANLNSYLKVTSQSNGLEDIVPKIREVESEKEKKPKSTIFLKMLIASIILFALLGMYAYNMIEEEKNRVRESATVAVTKSTPIPHPPLKDRSEEKEETKPKPQIDTESDISKKKTTHESEYIEETKTEEEDKIEIDINVPKEEIIAIDEEPLIEEIIPPKSKSNISNSLKFNKVNVKNFLESFISSAERDSIDEILSHYDKNIDRYFSLHGVTHKNIYRDKIQYNKKWVQREFKLLDFEILSISKIDEIEYCDLKKRTRWSVTSNYGKTASGVSRVFMVLKKTPSGFKVKSIYSF